MLCGWGLCRLFGAVALLLGGGEDRVGLRLCPADDDRRALLRYLSSLDSDRQCLPVGVRDDLGAVSLVRYPTNIARALADA